MQTTSPSPSQNAIGRALHLSSAMMAKMKKQGCPMHSVEAARAWRQNNIKPTMHAYLKASRALPAPPKPSRAIQHAEALVLIAHRSLEAGQPIDALVPTLRAALAAVPPSERGTYAFLTWSVMDVLTAEVFALLPKGENPMTDDDHPIYCNRNMSDDEAEYLGSFWYHVAAGEVRPAW